MKAKHIKDKGDKGKKMKDVKELFGGKEKLNPKNPEQDDKPAKEGSRATKMKHLSKKLAGKML